MTRLHAVDPAGAAGRQKELLDAVKGKFGAVPNLFRTAANSPAALSGLLDLFGALDGAQLPVALREKIALAVAEQNGCEYCLSAHSYLGKAVGLDERAIAEARDARAADAAERAALTFAVALVKKRGAVDTADFQGVREAGFGDAEIVEIVATVALNIFTNYLNIAGAVEVDFPRVRLRKAA